MSTFNDPKIAKEVFRLPTSTMRIADVDLVKAMAHVMVERHPASVELKLWINDEDLVVSYGTCETRLEHGNRLRKHEAAKQMVAACMNGA